MRDLVKSFQIMGMSESEAIEAARGRGHVADSGERLVEAFQDMGLGAVDAREAARGRGRVYGARIEDQTDKSRPAAIRDTRRPVASGAHVGVNERVNMPVNLREKGRIT
jgi:hypothetical protein